MFSEEEKAKFAKVCEDEEITKVLPALKETRIVVHQKSNTGRYAMMRPLMQCCKQVIDADCLEGFISVFNQYGGGGGGNGNSSNNGERIHMIITELSRDVTPRICEIVREKAKEVSMNMSSERTREHLHKRKDAYSTTTLHQPTKQTFWI